MRLVLTVLLSISVAILSGCIPASYRTHSRSLIYQIEKNPSRYMNQTLAFEGRVIQASESKNRIIFQIIAQNYPNDFGGSAITVVYENGNTTIARNHNVKVLGKIGNTIEGENAFGAKITSITMQAIAVWDITAERVSWLKEHEGVYKKWSSGKLFAPTKIK